MKRDYERMVEIVRLRIVEGLTLQAIGTRYGLTRERVRQVIDSATDLPENMRALHTLYKQTMKEKRSTEYKTKTRTAIHELRSAGKSIRGIAKDIGMSHSRVAQILMEV